MGSSSSSSSKGSGSSKIPEMKQGDLIRVDRYWYFHWAIVDLVEGEDVWCYHITNLANNNSSSNSNSPKAVIKREKINEIIGQDEYIIYNQEAWAIHFLKRYDQLLPDFDRVRGILKEIEGRTVNYKLFDLNCECFATFCKYGIGWSFQGYLVWSLFEFQKRITT